MQDVQFLEKLNHYHQKMQDVIIYLSNGSRVSERLVEISETFISISIRENRVVEVLATSIVKVIPKKPAYSIL
ncbi:MAG TPA: hypothetical protein VLA13_06690 [Massilibacterium sp.]|nr:hypothetical protein [Massilibacterium sp.]